MFLAFHRAWKEWAPLELLKKFSTYRIISILFSRILTISVVLIGWIFFRTHNLLEAENYLTKIICWSNDGTRMLSSQIIIAIVLVSFIHYIISKDRNWAQEIVNKSIFYRAISYSALLIIVVTLGQTDVAPVIYFQF